MTTQAQAGADAPRIILPLDGSPRAERALDLAAVLAGGLGARLLLLRVPLLQGLEMQMAREQDGSGVPAVFPSMQELVARARGEAKAYLDTLGQQLAERGIASDATVVEASPADAILEAADGAHMIVMASHGRGGLERWAFGSVTDKVLQAAESPLILVREPSEWPAEGPRRILVPLDGSALAERVLPQVTKLARAFGSEIELLRVLAGAEEIGSGDGATEPQHGKTELRAAWAEDYLAEQARQLAESGLTVKHRVLPAADVAEGLLAREAEPDIDLVAMTTHGLGGVRRWAFGSVADRMLRSALSPILLLRSVEERGQN
jgi:nucleotide-binding universal stress UspA family protein